jgi:hypothetical protein
MNVALAYATIFTIFIRFPDNIVRLDLKDPESAWKFDHICCVEYFIIDSSGQLQVKARPYRSLKKTFSTPFQSSVMGNFLSLHGPANESIVFPFSRIKGKCFAFPLKMTLNEAFDPLNVNQTWIFQEIHHSDS